ncbi:MAG: hypothetical protein FD127_4311 [Acidimicrobiaceae bacterium]|nr:MAG: hypothetical protein FD127_4311 [Acidimicrobiaceae bacterium]
MRHQQLIANLGLILALGVSAAAEQGGGIIRREEPPQSGREIEQSAVRFAGSWRPNGMSGDTKVIGTVIDIRQVPVSAVRVQLRNLDTGTVEQETDSNDQGEYEFAVENSGTYVVEMVMVDGYVVALSNAGSLARFETLQTVVQLPGRWDISTRTVVVAQDMTSFFGMSAETTMTATTIQIAVDQDVRPADPGTPVSP